MKAKANTMRRVNRITEQVVGQTKVLIFLYIKTTHNPWYKIQKMYRKYAFEMCFVVL